MPYSLRIVGSNWWIEFDDEYYFTFIEFPKKPEKYFNFPAQDVILINATIKNGLLEDDKTLTNLGFSSSDKTINSLKNSVNDIIHRSVAFKYNKIGDVIPFPLVIDYKHVTVHLLKDE